MSDFLPIKTPDYGEPVKAVIKHFEGWNVRVANMIAVDEDDCTWRFEEDNCELTNEWNVIYWEYK